MRRAAIVAALALSACAAMSKYDAGSYSPGDATPQQFARESAACELEGHKARSTYGAGGLAAVAAYNESYNHAFDACMRSKGFTRKSS